MPSAPPLQSNPDRPYNNEISPDGPPREVVMEVKDGPSRKSNKKLKTLKKKTYISHRKKSRRW